jgi:uncharacterized protein (DUF362 family)
MPPNGFWTPTANPKTMRLPKFSAAPSHAAPSHAAPSHAAQPTILRDLPGYPAISPTLPTPSHPGVAALLRAAGLDSLNPFAPWIQPGMSVLIKPNWVRHAATGWADLEALTTHPSILRPVVEFAAAALRLPDGTFSGQIILADAPLQSADFDLLMQQSGLPPLLAYWRQQGIPIRLVDLRRVIADTDDTTAVVRDSRSAPGDPLGDTIVDLGSRSRLDALLSQGGRVGVSNYDSTTTTQHHQPGRHQYRIANSLLSADVVLNLPKWKTHVKTGITGALKNFIGINCDKAYLPHFRIGSPRQGGDEYPDSWKGKLLASLRPVLERSLPAPVLDAARRLTLAVSRKTQSPMVFGGAWPGNDTLWRTVHDMVFIARWLGPGGALLAQPRPVLSLMDAVVAGEGDGPLRPETAPFGALLFGVDPGWVDVHAAALSGCRWQDIEVLAHLADAEAQAISDFDSAAPLPTLLRRLKAPASWRQRLAQHPANPISTQTTSTQTTSAQTTKETAIEAA